MKRIYRSLLHFAHTDLGDNIICTILLLAGMALAHQVIWALFAQGWR